VLAHGVLSGEGGELVRQDCLLLPLCLITRSGHLSGVT
jgi:hypothetical protein